MLVSSLDVINLHAKNTKAMCNAKQTPQRMPNQDVMQVYIQLK